MKILKKIGAILLNILATLVLVCLIVWVGLMITKFLIYDDYMEYREKVSDIPALNDGFVPQGLACTDDGVYIHTGYNGNAMEMHLVDADNKEKQLLPLNPDGTPCKGHGGGVTQNNQYVHVANEGQIISFLLSDLLAAKDGDTVKAVGAMDVDTEASFCFSDGNDLYVGEFYREKDYEIDPSHGLITPVGDQNRALVSCYPLSEDGSIADSYPIYSISITDQVQGFAVKDGVYMLSCSWGLNDSELMFYNGLKNTEKTIGVSGKDVPLYYLDSSNLIEVVSMPAFSEGLDVVGDRVIISFESACNKYVVGKLFFANKVISYPIPTYQ